MFKSTVPWSEYVLIGRIIFKNAISEAELGIILCGGVACMHTCVCVFVGQSQTLGSSEFTDWLSCLTNRSLGPVCFFFPARGGQVRAGTPGFYGGAGTWKLGPHARLAA